ncbi:GIY-YIG nuclease family protein [Bacillus mycoides]|uniref:GIY-YIG nuclease family protein n=1 Tax=Bacillus mycoides TaxID=1405 RepID=UPI003D2567B0
MNKQGVIYKIENLVNGKVYIGQTVRNYKRRMYEHRRKLRNNRHDNLFLQNAWNKYEETSFSFSIITECVVNELDELEVEWISLYQEKNLSYNLESGGSTNKKLHEQTKRKLSKYTKELGWIGGEHPRARKVICINTGRVYDSIVEASKDINASYGGLFNVLSGKNKCVRGKDNKYYQFAYYEEGKEYKLKKIKNIKNPKKVILVNTGEIFNSTREASEKIGVLQSHISMCCNGKRQHAGQLNNNEFIVWRFEDDYNPNEIFSFEKRKVSTYKSKKVICLTTNEVFPSITEALRKFGMSEKNSGISLVCKGKRKYAGKLSDGTPLEWKYCD